MNIEKIDGDNDDFDIYGRPQCAKENDTVETFLKCQKKFFKYFMVRF
jgi:hypothetical protein